MRTSREELGNASGLESTLSETDGSTETRASSTDDDGVVLVIDNLVGSCDVGLCTKNGLDMCSWRKWELQGGQEAYLLSIGGLLGIDSLGLRRAVDTLNNRRRKEKEVSRGIWEKQCAHW